MTNVSNTKTPKAQAPYVSFATFKSLIYRMSNEGAVPAKIDKSYLSAMSGAYQQQVLTALRVLKLIDDQNAPTDALRTVVENPDERLSEFLRIRGQDLYADAIDLAKRNGTAAQLADFFKSTFDVSGSTLRGAIRFYLELSKFADLPVGKHFRPPTRTRNPAKKTPAGPKQNPPSAESDSEHKRESRRQSQNSLSVRLSSGGFVSLSADVDVTQLTREERSFVFELIDMVRSFEESAQGQMRESSSQGSSADEE